MFDRALRFPADPDQSFFLWGARQTGKSSLMRKTFPNAPTYDLLKTDEYLRLTTRPAFFREELLAQPHRFVIVDEIQKVPMLLDEAHWLIENGGFVFGFCGSSARKLRRGHANLLGGRALRHELHGLVSKEIGRDFDLLRALNHGYLPRHYLSSAPERLIASYVRDYLTEEIAQEGLVRRLPAFSNFLSSASLSDTELVNYTTIARDCGVSSPTVKEYFQILADTLIARFVPAYVRRPKRRTILTPKFYFHDVGVVNSLARRGRIQARSEVVGKAFENWVCHELTACSAYRQNSFELSYWRLASGIEVDFILGDMHAAIEAKGTERVTDDHLRGLRELKRDHPKVKRRIVVCLEERPRRTEDEIDILPHAHFTRQLWSGEIV
jgi:predicted AAA+ superfamily ATPase